MNLCWCTCLHEVLRKCRTVTHSSYRCYSTQQDFFCYTPLLLHSNYSCCFTAQCPCWYTPLLLHTFFDTSLPIQQPLSFLSHFPFNSFFHIHHFYLPFITPYSFHPSPPFFISSPLTSSLSHMLLITFMQSYQFFFSFHSHWLMWNSLWSTFQQVLPHRLQHLIWDKD